MHRTGPVRRGSCALAAWLMVQGAYGQTPAPAADSKPVIVPLEVVASAAGFTNSVEFEGGVYAVPVTTAGTTRTGTALSEIAIRTEGLGGDPPRARLWIDVDADGDLDKETPLVLTRDESVTVKVKRKRAGGATRSYQVDLGGDDRAERISWAPLYRAQGLARIDGKDHLVQLQDFACDGAFTLTDAHQGSALGLDLDGDGEIRGFVEHFGLSEIISIGQRQFTIESLTDSQLVLAPVSVQIPAVGTPIPPITLKTLDGGEIALAGPRIRPLLVDFWASWCAPCLAKMPKVKDLAADRGLDLLYFSIDTQGPGTDNARQIIDKEGIAPARVVMGGQGARDEAFRMFASTPADLTLTSANGTKRVVKRRAGSAIPLLALIDKNGVLRYMGNGDLDALKKAIDEVQGSAPK